ncbi:MAG: 2-phospho-L-lactate transferase [Gammaproteobacteria bacterium]|nr:MAG: 2-phospho-L-lactate transferase [Gammaproteobacteria bacterium]
MAAAHYLALTGGVGGAKLALGLSRLLEPDQLRFVVNTGDDFDHLGLHISPDIDTLIYTLAGLCNTETGWGRANESWQFMTALSQLNGEDWFRLGDRDLAMHIERTRRLAAGMDLTHVIRELAGALGVRHPILPMTDDPVRTTVDTAQGELAFQHYFVRDRCAPAVTGVRFVGAEQARLSPSLSEALRDPALAGVIVCPSNPYLSIDPILAVPPLRAALTNLQVPVVAVSPIVAGAAIKGPTAKMMRELDIPNTAVEIARYYRSWIDGFILDEADRALKDEVQALGLATVVTRTVMVSLEDRVALAREALQLIDQPS